MGSNNLLSSINSISQLINAGDDIAELDISLIKPRDEQHRKHFDEKKLNDLAESIKQMGIQVPIIVQEVEKNKAYEIIAGERRYRACLIVGLEKIPAIIKRAVDKPELIQFAENILREDLNAVEKALAIVEIMHKEGLSQTELAAACGKSKQWVSKQLRILDQPEDVKELAKSGHIRDLNTLFAIGGLPDDERKSIINQIKKGGFNYKQYLANKQPASKSNFSFSRNELLKIFDKIGFSDYLKKEHPNWETYDGDAFINLFQEFKSTLQDKEQAENSKE